VPKRQRLEENTEREQLTIEVLRTEIRKNEAAIKAYESEVVKNNAAAKAYTAFERSLTVGQLGGNNTENRAYNPNIDNEINPFRLFSSLTELH
jgi:hypothetical protein